MFIRHISEATAHGKLLGNIPLGPRPAESFLL
jgi:hypothetical protein